VATLPSGRRRKLLAELAPLAPRPWPEGSVGSLSVIPVGVCWPRRPRPEGSAFGPLSLSE